ncbi:MAG: hypothetical protein LHV68_08755 [Elusimicrobia bacterium]|nr:hypothetical protein [Candidatus Liberimonas magnetica]
MKIICSSCKKTIGEIAPFKDSSETQAKCNDCIAKEREALSRFKAVSNPKDEEEVVLKNGLKGRVWAAKNKKEFLSAWELGISGKKFFCSDQYREEFQKHIESIKDEQFDISFFHSITATINSELRKRNIKEVHLKAKNKKDDAVYYNCTVKVNKRLAQSIYDWMADRFNKFIKILSESEEKKIQNIQK